MPIVVLTLHFLILSFLAALVPWKLLPFTPKLASFNGGFKQAFCFGMAYSLLTYGAVIIIASSGYTPGSSTMVGRIIMNGGWMIGSALFLQLFACLRPNTFKVADSMVNLIGGFMLFFIVMLSVAALYLLMALLGVG